ncbi:hypothetical protein [Deinococcus sonorensis]|uniref:Uncharacterized protein n=2 Tax=Deinococcus sonorensis TaxID=309891 RepID=A0AAU7U9J7_9DEIO
MNNRTLSNLLTVLGFSSIFASIGIWAASGGQDADPDRQAHGERFGIFVGLWAPTFFVLANKYSAAADLEDKEVKAA